MRKTGKILSLFMALVLILSASGSIKAKADDTLLYAADSQPYYLLAPSQRLHLTVPVKIYGTYEIILSSIMAVSQNESIKVENLKLIYNGTDTEVDLTKYSGLDDHYGLWLHKQAMPEVCFDFDLVSDDEIKIGYNSVNFVGSGFELDGSDAYPGMPYANHKLELLEIVTYTSTEKSPAYVSVSSVDYDQDAVVPGNTVNVTFNVKNEGQIKILNTYMTLDFPNGDFIPNYTVESI